MHSDALAARAITPCIPPRAKRRLPAGPRRARIDRAGAGRGQNAAGIPQARRRVEAVGDVVGGRDLGRVERVLDLEEEHRAIDVRMIDLAVVVNVHVDETVA
jgi:hypothetical protein